jgi:hypothetical protein
MVNPKSVTRPVPSEFRVHLQHKCGARFTFHAVFTKVFSTAVRQGGPIPAFD